MSKIDLIDVTGMSDEEVLALITPEMLEEGERTMSELRRVMDSLSEDTGQTAYSSLMDPCPFCGGMAWIQYWEYPTGYGMRGRAVCGKCHVSTSMDFQSGRTAYLPTGEDITKPLLIKRVIETWNRRTERTCHMDMTETVPIKEHNHLFDLYDADGFLVGKANPGKKVMLADAFYVPERTCLAKPYEVDAETGFYDCIECECGEVNDISARYCNRCGGLIEVAYE